MVNWQLATPCSLLLSIDFFVLIVDALKAFAFLFWMLWRRFSAAHHPEKGNHRAQPITSHAKRIAIRLKAINYRRLPNEISWVAFETCVKPSNLRCKSGFNPMIAGCFEVDLLRIEVACTTGRSRCKKRTVHEKRSFSLASNSRGNCFEKP
jgi:hypothetical protein